MMEPEDDWQREVAVLDTTLAYLEVGTGPVLLFVHGNPSSSYQWRAVMPRLARAYRCLAVDLVGMGRSGKPDLVYSFDDHARHLDAFVAALGLADVTLILHDWGIALGLDLARRQPGLVRAVALVARGEELTEGVLAPIATWDDLGPEARAVFEAYRDDATGPELVLEQNHFVEVLLPANMLRQLTPDEMERYRAPFPTPASRRPILAFNREVPIAGKPEAMVERIDALNRWLRASSLPKLLAHASAEPGRPLALVDWAVASLSALTVVDVGPGLHYLTEDRPDETVAAIDDWLARTVLASS